MTHMDADNARILQLMSRFLNEAPDFIRPEEVRMLMQDCGVGAQEAFALLLAAAVGLDVEARPADRALYHRYFPRMVHALDPAAFEADAYYRRVRVQGAREGRCALRQGRIAPCEAFVCDDILCLEDGRMIPQIGFFQRAFTYPAILEGGREWMTVTPNEIATMREPIARAHGRVLTYGLGLGYFAHGAACKEEVESVTVVEQNADVIALFRRCILPQLACGEKIRIVQGDAFAFAGARRVDDRFDFAFADLWHDVGDGLPMYRRLRALEERNPNTEYAYWIERSMRCYL